MRFLVFLTLTALFGTSTVQAYHMPPLTPAVVCETREQAEQFLQARAESDRIVAMNAVNDAADEQPACMYDQISASIVERFGIQTTPKGLYQIVKVRIWGTLIGRVIIPPMRPLYKYTGVLLKGDPA